MVSAALCMKVLPHMRQSLLLSTLCCLFLQACCPAAIRAQSAVGGPRWNIVVVLADDLGWSDLGCYGGDLVETPHLDGLAASAMMFTSAYAMPVCSPSRAALLTGRHAARVGMTIWSEGSRSGPQNRQLLQGSSRHDLPHSEITLAEILQSNGYLTAMIGKWHLGDADHYPPTQGFDISIGGTHWGAPFSFFWPYRGAGRFGPEFRYVPGLDYGKPGEYLTDRLTDEALHVIDRAADAQRPFFLYLSHHAPHTPIQAPEDDIRRFEERLTPDLHHQNATYAAMVYRLDLSVGRILEKLQERQLDSSTVVVFVSDNGGFIGKDKNGTIPVTSNAPLRSGKGSLYEGGIRVPLIVRWPGRTQPGSSSDEPVILMDLFQTLRAHVPVLEELPVIDGIDLAPVLINPAAELDRKALHFHYPHYYPTTTPVGAIRAGDWKLLEYFEDESLELYNLAEDPGESSNLAEQQPQRAAAMLSELRSWREETNASMPTLNPNRRQ